MRIEYDGKNIYKIATNYDYGEECSSLNFISDYIPFTKDAALINRCILENSIFSAIFCTVPTVPKEKQVYGDAKNKEEKILVTNNNVMELFSDSSEKIFQKLINNQFGLDYYLNEQKQKSLLLKSENIILYFDDEGNEPRIIGLSDGSKIVPLGKVESSSFSKEKNISYEAENLRFIKLKHPWVEGIDGPGLEEYIKFNKKSATGMYLINGYISLERPDLYSKNNRIEKILITGSSSNTQKEFLLVDTVKPQYIDLQAFENNEEITISLKSFYKGTLYDDTCLSGLILVKR